MVGTLINWNNTGSCTGSKKRISRLSQCCQPFCYAKLQRFFLTVRHNGGRYKKSFQLKQSWHHSSQETRNQNKTDCSGVFTCFSTLCFRSSAPIPLPHSLAALKSPELFFTATMTDRPCASAAITRCARQLWRVEQHRVVVVVVPQIKKGLHAVQLESSGGQKPVDLGWGDSRAALKRREWKIF